MIVYFADRKLNILGQASTELLGGLSIISDEKAEDVETGVAVFECKILFDKNTRDKVTACTEVGNYILRSHDNENEFYTIIDAEIDTKKQTAYIYAEDAGLDLLNEVVGEYEADKAYPINHYIEKFAYDSGFQIGINEASGLTRKLSWDGEATVTARLASVATQFDGCEISYSFDIDGLIITRKYINIYKQRGNDDGVTLRLNKDIDNIITSKSIANLATALRCTGGTPEDAEDPITLRGYSYDDGDFYVDGDVLKSREAVKKWSRYIWDGEQNLKEGHEGHIVKPFSYDTTEKSTLCAHAITELKSAREIEVNYEVDIKKLPNNVRIGDRVNIVDEAGELYLSTRILQLKASILDQSHMATLGEHLIKSNGISQKVATLAAQFAATAKSAARALLIANNAKSEAVNAKEQASNALVSSETAQKAAEAAQKAANTANESALLAQEKASEAQSAVDRVEEGVTSLETTITNAQKAADNAQTAAETAQSKADEAAEAAAQAIADAADANAAVVVAQSAAETAITKADEAKSTADTAKNEAETAQSTAEAAKLDAQKAQEDIDSLGDNLETISQTMQADYARKTDLTEAEASLQSQISQNAAQISSTVSSLERVDETANNAQEQASQAQATANTAQEKANQATADAQAAQTAANTAAQAATSAQSEADAAKAAAATAQWVADKAEADLEAAKADLATVSSRVDATEKEIEDAQNAVEAAQAAANKANADAEAAAKKATDAQSAANTATTKADAAQTAANDAANAAAQAQQAANEAIGNAAAAQAKADEAATVAATAQETANTAKANATGAQTKADQAAREAAAAQKAADDADAKAAQAADDLETAKQNLASVTSRVGATEEEVAKAQEAVEVAQAAANKAKDDAATAQSAANDAKADAATAQAAANNAKDVADAAQAAADEAQQAADDAQAAVNALSVRVTKTETDIVQTNEQIKLLATKEEVTQTLGGYYTKEQTDAAIAVRADEINLSVSQTIEEMEIGGRNYLLDSADERSAVLSTIDYELSHDIEWLKSKAGETITLSFEAKGNEECEYQIDAYFRENTTGYQGVSPVHTLGPEYAKYSQVMSIPSIPDAATTVCIRIRGNQYVGNQQNTGNFYIRNVKLEFGIKATDWTPAPEEVSSDIAEAQNEASSAKNTADNAVKDIAEAEAAIRLLKDSIKTLVRDGNNESMMFEDENGWYFSTKNIQDQVNTASSSLAELVDKMGSMEAAINALSGSAEEFGEIARYVHIGEYTYKDANGQEQIEPSIDLFQTENKFKLKITNKRIVFTDGATELMSLNTDTKSLTAPKATIESELQIGGEKRTDGVWIWKQRENGNLGLIWKGVSS